MLSSFAAKLKERNSASGGRPSCFTCFAALVFVSIKLVNTYIHTHTHTHTTHANIYTYLERSNDFAKHKKQNGKISESRSKTCRRYQSEFGEVRNTRFKNFEQTTTRKSFGDTPDDFVGNNFGPLRSKLFFFIL